ncbi:MAG: gliding motility protein GldM [Bacteroidales bacterium]|nr:gliding motility protein GldM [Bacteroidales bacterium]
MAATNCPETPRQRMIGMMYLVYTAMLALNVSAEILNGFVNVGDSMDVTNNLLATKTASAYQMFENTYNNNPGKVQENWDKALQVKKATNDLVTYIDDLKYELIATVEGYKGGKAEAKKNIEQGLDGKKGYVVIKKKDNVSESVNFMLGSEQNENSGKAADLKKKINDYQTKMMNLCADRYKKQLATIQIDTKSKRQNAEGKELGWSMFNFYQGILVADVVVLNKLKSEIKNQEYDMINNLYADISADDFKFDKVVAKVIPKETYIMQGGSYEADIIVAAYDSRSQLRGELAGASLTATDSGTLRLKMGAGALGPKKYKGIVFVKKESGEVPYDFSGEYFVAAPSVTISATKMNVLYIGVDNPIAVGAPGVRSEDLNVTISGDPSASIRKVGTGEYIVNVKTPGKKVSINASAKMGGTVKNLGSMDYRVKTIPKPTVKVGDKQDGKIAKEVLTAQGGFRVSVEGFDFPVKYVVDYYKMEISTGGDAQAPMEGRGDRFTSEMLTKIGKLRRGQKVFITDIRVKGPSGVVAAANPSMTFTIQ